MVVVKIPSNDAPEMTLVQSDNMIEAIPSYCADQSLNKRILPRTSWRTEDLLDAHGYKTLQTRNGMEALALAREHRPDLILMDIQLPEVSGLEVTKWLKEDDQLRQIPVVAVTAFAMKGDEERIREGGCEAYISKPISVTMFLDTVRQFIGEAR